MNRSSKVLLMVATIVAIIVNLVSCIATSSKEDTSIMIVAHRGGAALKKENSLEAFETALLYKIDAIELDVHLSKDGVLIVHHDPVVMNEKGVKVPIREHYADYLSTLFIDGYQHIPTFKEVLLLIKETCDYPLTLFVEIKVDERNRRYPDIEDKVLSLLTETDLSDSSWILSFDFPTLIDVKAKNEKIHTSALISKTYLTSVGSKGVDKVISDMKSLKVSSVSVKDIYLTQTLIDALHKENLLVGVWTVNKEKDMKVFKEMKVDVITSDNPLLLRETLNIY